MSSFKERDNSSCSRKSRNDDNDKKMFYIANNLKPPTTVTNKKIEDTYLYTEVRTVIRNYEVTSPHEY